LYHSILNHNKNDLLPGVLQELMHVLLHGMMKLLSLGLLIYFAIDEKVSEKNDRLTKKN